ncbi:hypothetical protein ACFQ0G_10070 [Streptomyces chiangmaiensis]
MTITKGSSAPFSASWRKKDSERRRSGLGSRPSTAARKSSSSSMSASVAEAVRYLRLISWATAARARSIAAISSCRNQLSYVRKSVPSKR